MALSQAFLASGEYVQLQFPHFLLAYPSKPRCKFVLVKRPALDETLKILIYKIENAKKAGLHLFGFADVSGQTVQVVKEEKKR